MRNLLNLKNVGDVKVKEWLLLRLDKKYIMNYVKVVKEMVIVLLKSVNIVKV